MICQPIVKTTFTGMSPIVANFFSGEESVDFKLSIDSVESYVAGSIQFIWTSSQLLGTANAFSKMSAIGYLVDNFDVAVCKT